MPRISAERYAILGRRRLSKNFLLRDFLFSTEAAAAGHSNFPDDEEQVVKSGQQLCVQVLEPILERFGHFTITFGYQARETLEHSWSNVERDKNPTSSSPHQWDRGTFGKEIYARVDILPTCVEAGDVTKQEFGFWCMDNFDIDLLMQFPGSNVFCITISPHPRRAWWEWVANGEGDKGSNKIVHRGREYWMDQYPKLSPEHRPRSHPSAVKSWNLKVKPE